MPKGLCLCTQCGYSYTSHVPACPNCGKVREKPKHRSGQIIVACDWPGCGAQVGQHGLGQHMRRHRNEQQGTANAYGPRGAEKLGGTWTVSLVNGKRQIAATVDGATAQKIITILAG